MRLAGHLTAVERLLRGQPAGAWGETGRSFLAVPGKGLMVLGTPLLLLHLRSFLCAMKATLRRELRGQICDLGRTAYFMELLNGTQVLLI